MKEIYIKIAEDGPYLLYGKPKLSKDVIIADNEDISIEYAEGRVFEITKEPVALCRCGKTKNAPFCDESHIKSDFNGNETASFKPFLDNAVKYEGFNFDLYDNEQLCACARFCDANGSVWTLVLEENPDSNSEVERQVRLCPSGRLVLFDKYGNMLEEELPKSISLIEDNGLKISGPIWVKGGIRIESANGQSYEIRNRQTLCRCGHSKNKPFCDCSHVHIKFKADYS